MGSSTDLIMQHVEFVQGNDKRQVLLDLINTVEVRARVWVRVWIRVYDRRGYGLGSGRVLLDLNTVVVRLSGQCRSMSKHDALVCASCASRKQTV